VSTCRSCGAAITWTVTVAGKRMPVDLEPVPGGNIDLVNGTAHVHGLSDAPDGLTPRYVSHFVTCPHADSHRKAR
jgi:hypothetical protein